MRTARGLRTAGGNIARGFFNDFDIDDARETQAQRFETIQFFVRDGDAPDRGELSGPVHPEGAPPGAGVEQVPAAAAGDRRRAAAPHRRFRRDPDARRRLPQSALLEPGDGALLEQGRAAAPIGRLSKNAIVVPMRKTAEWWQKSALERHSYFYPHVDHASAAPVKGHALAAEKGIPSLFRRVYHNPDGYERPGEFDFVTYFECDDESLPVFDQVLTSLRDVQQNPEWRYVEEGPIWRGKRVLRW